MELLHISVQLQDQAGFWQMIKRTTFLVRKVLDNTDIKMQLYTVERDESTGYRGRSFDLFERPHGARQGRKDDVYGMLWSCIQMHLLACWPFTKPRFLSLFCVITTFIPLCKGIGGKSESQFPIRRAHSPSKDLSTTREFIWLEAFLATVSTVPVGCEDKVSKIRLSEGNPSQIRWSWMGSSNAQVVGPFSHVIEKWLQFGICASELLHEFVMWHRFEKILIRHDVLNLYSFSVHCMDRLLLGFIIGKGHNIGREGSCRIVERMWLKMCSGIIKFHRSQESEKWKDAS